MEVVPTTQRVRHLRTGYPSVYSNCPHPPYPALRQRWHDRSDHLRSQSSSPQMIFRAHWLSIPCLQHSTFLPAPAWTLSLRLQHALLPERFLSQHNPWSISLSLGCSKSAFLVLCQRQASFWIPSCAMPLELRLFLLPSHSWLESLDDIVVWKALAICCICQPAVVKCSVSKYPPI